SKGGRPPFELPPAGGLRPRSPSAGGGRLWRRSAADRLPRLLGVVVPIDVFLEHPPSVDGGRERLDRVADLAQPAGAVVVEEGDDLLLEDAEEGVGLGVVALV